MTEVTQMQRFYDLVQELRFAKLSENVAKKKRIALEETIAAAVPSKPDGQCTVEVTGDDGNTLKVIVKRGLGYKTDIAAIDKYFRREPKIGNKFATPPIKSSSTRELDLVGYEWYRKNCPEIFAEIAKHVEVTPKKVSVTIKA